MTTGSLAVTTSIEKATHSPAPWRLREGDYGHFVEDADIDTVAHVYTMSNDSNGDLVIPWEAGEANAHLIAAAPALLEAAAAFIKALDTYGPAEVSPVGKFANDFRAAIAAAKGEA